MAIFLKCINSETPFKIKITVHPVTFGRSSKADFKLNDAKVSSKHCTVKLLNNKVVVTDLGSTNGTFINEFKADESFFYIGDQLRIGNSKFVIDIDQLSQQEMTANTKVDDTNISPTRTVYYEETVDLKTEVREKIKEARESGRLNVSSNRPQFEAKKSDESQDVTVAQKKGFFAKIFSIFKK